MSAADLHTFHVQPERLRHPFADEFAHVARGADLGLAEALTIVAPLYTLTDRQAVGSSENAWKWQCRGRHQRGTESEWLPEEELRDSFISLQLDVFHALREMYKDKDRRPRPAASLLKGERDHELRTQALNGSFRSARKSADRLRDESTTPRQRTVECDTLAETGRSLAGAA